MARYVVDMRTSHTKVKHVANGLSVGIGAIGAEA
jgi:hypothetical protein